MLAPTLAASRTALPPKGAGQSRGGPSTGRCLGRVVIWLILSALVAAQALGLMHRTVHLPHGQDHAHEHHAHEHDDHAHHEHSQGWVADLFAGHDDGDATCRLFDPLNLEGAACVPAVALPAISAFFFLAQLQGEFLVRWVALFDARGPPAAA